MQKSYSIIDLSTIARYDQDYNVVSATNYCGIEFDLPDYFELSADDLVTEGVKLEVSDVSGKESYFAIYRTPITPLVSNVPLRLCSFYTQDSYKEFISKQGEDGAHVDVTLKIIHEGQEHNIFTYFKDKNMDADNAEQMFKSWRVAIRNFLKSRVAGQIDNKIISNKEYADSLNNALVVSEVGSKNDEDDSAAVEVTHDLDSVELVEVPPGDRPFLSSVQDYTVRHWMVNMYSNTTQEEKEALAELNQLSDSTKRILFDLEKRYKAATMCIGDVDIFKKEWKKIHVKGQIKEEETQTAKSLKEYNEVDHILSRIPQAAKSGEMFLPLFDNSRTGDIMTYINLFENDPESALYGVVEARAHALYPVALEHCQSSFHDFVQKDARVSAVLDLLPKAPEIKGRYADADLDLVNDWQVSMRERDRAISVQYNTQGGFLFAGKQMAKKTPFIEMGYFAECMYEGKPRIWMLKHAYTYNIEFRELIDNQFRAASEKRRRQESFDFWDKFLTASSFILNSRPSSLFDPGEVKPMNVVQYGRYLDTLHHDNRKILKMITRDITAYQAGITRICAAPTEDVCIQMHLDLFFSRGVNHHLLSAVNYINVGYNVYTNGHSRARMHKTDQTASHSFGLDKYDIRFNEGAPTLYLDMTYHGKEIFIGGSTWAERTNSKTKAGLQDKRAIAYADYEPDESIKSANGLIHPKPPPYKEEIVKIDKILGNLGKFDYVGTLVPSRLAYKYAAKFHCVLVLPAPPPANMSFFMLFSSKAEGAKANTSHLARVADYQRAKLFFMLDQYSYGTSGLRNRYINQMKFCGKSTVMLNAWVKLLKARYVDNASTGRRVILQIVRMTKTDSAQSTRSELSELFAKSADNLNSFIPDQQDEDDGRYDYDYEQEIDE